MVKWAPVCLVFIIITDIQTYRQTHGRQTLHGPFFLAPRVKIIFPWAHNCTCDPSKQPFLAKSKKAPLSARLKKAIKHNAETCYLALKVCVGAAT